MSEPLSLRDAFQHINSFLENPVTLRVYNGGIYSYYDFAQRQRTVHTTPTFVTPFHDMNREVLIAARDKLIDLGGTPPELAAEAPSLPRQQKGLNP